MARRLHLNRRPVSIISFSVSLPSIAILGKWGREERSERRGEERRGARRSFPATFGENTRPSRAPARPPRSSRAGAGHSDAARLGSAPGKATRRRGSRSRSSSSSGGDRERRRAEGLRRGARLGSARPRPSPPACAARAAGPPGLAGRRWLMRGAGGGGTLCPRLPADARSAPAPPVPAAATMSHVRLSNGSPTLERMEARQADYPKPSACRSLFGPVDHDQVARELQRHQRDLAEASRRKWNFDFQRHQPLDGRYEWRALAQAALPDFYSRPPRLRGRAAHPPPRTAAADPAETPAGPRKRAAPADPDDSSHQNKRANATEVIPEDSPSASSVEQTPKKSSPRRHQT